MAGGGCDLYELIGHDFAYIPADCKKKFKGPHPFNSKNVFERLNNFSCVLT
jgi:hypothetical protein